VPVYQEGRGSQGDKGLLVQAKALREAGELVAFGSMGEQMKRERCELSLPEAGVEVLEGRELWKKARAGHMRVGFYYQCLKCDDWHLDLAGGYAITADGAVATCAHVLTEPSQMKEGYLIAATDDDLMMPVTEVLAVSLGRDSAIVRVKGAALMPLALATDVSPGDEVWCFSDPAGKRGYYSGGVVSRFVRKKELAKLPKGAEVPRPVWLETTVDWAPGSSGSAVVDAKGNCVGHVSEIQTVLEDLPARKRAKAEGVALGTQIVFHHAIAAGEVRALIRGK
jgi:S1-C subfamily serine protease